jgi:uncharacterized protein with FMN-binding domain
VILQLKEIVYTAIFVGFGILLLVLLFFMFWPEQEKDTSSTSSSSSVSDSASAGTGNYIAGVYTSELTLGDSTINLQVSLDEDRVKAVEIVNLEDSVETMYPLIKPAVKEISDQLANDISPEEVVLSDDSPYTSQLILDTVSQILEEASVE